MSTGGGYDPHTLEADIYRFWEEGDHFRAVPNPDRKPYVIDIPLPNVTGSLHLGHAINETCQDVLIRYHRMRGFEALWMPGTDHAGIATQAVVERRLKEEHNLTRHELGRDGLVARIWDWKENYGSRILAQLRKMGFSCDWDRTRFTLDEICAKAVYEVFFQWFKAGLIFRGTRLVNWDTHLQTAVADDEVIHETVKGHFWHYRYPIEGHDATAPEARETIDYVVIATTRPETMLGDTAICVHPDDARYRHLVGKNCVLPLLNRPIPIIADGQLAKMELGTGVVKVTPGHDPRDYECGLRNKLAMLSILTPDGRITEHGGPYAGLSREQCRKQVVTDLEALGLMEKVESIEHDVGHSDRSKTPIEPLLSEQWFLRMGDLAELAMEAVRDGRVQFHPQRYAKTLLDWLGEKRDWCISRQLWWGHRIPVWSGDLRLSELLAPSTPQCAALFDRAEYSAILSVADLATGQRWHHLDSENGAGWRALRAELERGDRLVRIMVCAAPGERGEVRHDDAIAWCEERGFQRDPDVLDTWFSSALWPFSTLGWPDNYGRGTTEGDPLTDLDYFYPTSVLVTSRDIITLWVARMIITGLYFLDRVPFQHVYIHPVIQDGQGRRMSKSLGNGVDPLDIIALYGTDALRYTMAGMATETQDVRLPVKPITTPDGRTVNTSERFDGGRAFCNKLWQVATGFIFPNLEGTTPQPRNPTTLAIEDRWILSRLARATAEIDRRFAAYQLNDVVSTLYDFFWGDFCDWYVELVKPRLFTRRDDGHVAPRHDDSADSARQVLALVLDHILRLCHPVLPFITEALWQELNARVPHRGIAVLTIGTPALIRTCWPVAAELPRDTAVEREIDALRDIIRTLRDLLARVNTSRAAAKTPAVGKLPRAVIRVEEKLVSALRSQQTVLERLGRCENVEIGTDVAKPPESAAQVLVGVEVFVPLAGLMDLNAERTRLTREVDELRGHIERLSGKLAHEGFVAKAPAAVVEQERTRLAELRQKLAVLERNVADLA